MKVGIIGAGVAGLQVARRLRSAGADVQLFDKARGPSGRVATRRSDFGQFDHGAQYFTARDPRFEKQVEDWLAREVVAPWEGRIVELEAGEMRPEASPSKRFVGSPKMSVLGRDLLGDMAIDLSARVIGVEKQGASLALQIADGETQSDFDVVVSAVPAPQAEPLLALSPRFAAEVAKVSMLPCHAAMLTLAPGSSADAGGFDAGFDAAFVRGSGLSWAARNASKPGRGPEETWVLHSQPSWSEAHLDLPMNAVAEALRDEFETALGRPLPEPAALNAHRWLYARPAKGLDGTPLWDPSLGIGLCGDWTQGDRLEDAFVSAERLADAMLAEPKR
ncbi:MAG: NAD(P)/FAD-dependent oxidoreductase [Myxococcota bacterium]